MKLPYKIIAVAIFFALAILVADRFTEGTDKNSNAKNLLLISWVATSSTLIALNKKQGCC